MARDILILIQDLTLVCMKDTGNKIKHCSFASTIRAYQTGNTPLLNFEGAIIDHLQCIKRFTDLFYFKNIAQDDFIMVINVEILTQINSKWTK